MYPLSRMKPLPETHPERRRARLTGGAVAALSALLALLTPVAGGAPLSAQPMPELSEEVLDYVAVGAPAVALTGVRVIDGTGAAPAEDRTILIEEGRIRAVGPSGEIELPDGAEVLDLEGHTVIPGLVGLHNHTFYTTAGRRAQLSYSAPRLYLASGVTTVRTTGSYSPYSEINLKRSIERGETPGPRMHITGPYITGQGAGGHMYEVSGPEDARRVVAYWAEEGATWFKAYTRIGREELGAAIDEAHRRDLGFTGHLCSVSFREAVELGIDNLEHGFFVNSDWDPEKEPDECPSGMRERLLDVEIESEPVRETIRDMVENDVALTSTLAVYELSVPNRPPRENMGLELLAPEVREEYLGTREAIAEDADESFMPEVFRKAQAFEKAFAEAGGLLAAGVDPTGIGGALPGLGDLRNFELLVEAGFTPVETVRIMSANGARVLGEEDRIGSIEEGKAADLVVIEGDPADRPAEIYEVRLVFRNGIGFDSARLIESVRGEVGVR